ncbi:hypothetical protein [Brachyspira sp.]|uniref:hypothetical protein n=1 Tax=Brachyspira sp. TaxID=1977261 RepID=UPI003D7C701D
MHKYIISIILLCSNLLFGDLEVNFIGQYGFNFIFPSVDVKDNYKNSVYNSIKGGLGADASVFFQVGNYFKLFKNPNDLIKGASLFFDFGYSLHGGMNDYKDPATNKRSRELIFYHSIALGIGGKLNFSKISLGLGTGILAPLYAQMGSSEYYGTIITPDLNGWKASDMRNLFKAPIMPYIKLTIEGYYYLVEGIDAAILMGGYVMYNFGMQYKTDVINQNIGASVFNKYNFSALSFGILLGVSLGRTDGTY